MIYLSSVIFIMPTTGYHCSRWGCPETGSAWQRCLASDVPCCLADYDAVLTEAGDYTEKYFKLRKLLGSVLGTQTPFLLEGWPSLCIGRARTGQDFPCGHKLHEGLQSKGHKFESWSSHVKAVWSCMSVFKPFKPPFLP